MQIACVGAGPIGLIAAHAISRLGYSVRVFDPSADKPKMSLALAQSTLNFLGSLGIELNFGELLTEIHVSETGVPGSILLAAKELGIPHFGRVICSQAFQDIIERMTDVIVEPSQVLSITARGKKSEPFLQLSDGQQISADLVILADGGRSGLSEKLGFKPQLRDFNRTALIGRLKVSQPSTGRALERFVGTGPLAVLPVDRSEYGFIWSLAPPVAASYVERPELLIENLNVSLGRMLGSFSISNSPVRVSLVERWIDKPYRPGVVLLGNGAQTIHPVAGQGLNLALKGVDLLVSHLESFSIDEAVIRAHQAWKPGRDRTRVASSLIESIFDRNNAVRKLLTGTTFSLVDQSLFLKRLIAEAGMGIEI